MIKITDGFEYGIRNTALSYLPYKDDFNTLLTINDLMACLNYKKNGVD